jgi:sugar (pentulose or hexulose) kinase
MKDFSRSFFPSRKLLYNSPPRRVVARKFVLGVDSSTTSCKVIAWDRQGRPAAEGRSTYPTQKPRPGWYEQDAMLWWSSLCRALRELFQEVSPSQVEALCISNQRETIVAVDTMYEEVYASLFSTVRPLVDRLTAITRHRSTQP